MYSRDIQQKPLRSPKSRLAIASFILGLASFSPLGVLTGIIAILSGALGIAKIKKEQLSGRRLAIAGIILGAFGVVFSVAVYGSILYWSLIAKQGPFDSSKRILSQQVLTQTAGYLELYKKKHGRYPEQLEELSQEGYTVFPADPYLNPFYYRVSIDGQSYELRSLGQDGEYNTADDILPL